VGSYVVHPVTGSAERDTVRALGDGPDFSNDNPGARSPAVAEENDEEPDHGTSSPTGTGSATNSPLVPVATDETSNDDVARRHTNSARDQDRLAAKLVDVHDGWDGGNPHDNTNDTSSKQRDGVSRKAESLEDLGGVVEDGVDTSPLLEEPANTC